MRIAMPMIVVSAWLSLSPENAQVETGTPGPDNAAQLATSKATHAILGSAPSFEIRQRPDRTALFERVAEPQEQAFTLLVPKGWQLRGGIARVDPTRQGGPAQSIAAKVDFAVQNDADGSVMIYSDRESYDPNTDVQMNVSGFRRSSVRRR